VALLDRLTSNRHLSEAALSAAWADARLDGSRPAHPHLAGCPACRARLAELSTWLDDMRDDAVAEADAAFPSERLAAQHGQIFRRLEALGRSAKVIVFPKLAQPIASSTSPVRRWVASAAAAGLIAGVALGNYMDLRHTILRPATTPAADVMAGIQTAAAGQPISDEELLWHLEELSSSNMPESLTAFDSLTPRARDYPR
jgi:predicted anti-sigma-YlaC factor YlaD